jgi:hypothetical protein
LFNIRLGGIVGTLAFILSFLLGVISGTRLPIVLLRALIFAAVFMLLSGGIYTLVSMYLPDLLSPPDMPGSGRGGPGSRLDISLDDPEEGLAASYFQGGAEKSPEFGDNQDLSDENLGTLSEDGLDHTGEDGYTIGGESEPGTLEPYDPNGSSDPTESSDPVSTEELPDFDKMASAFGDDSGGSFAGNSGESSDGISELSSPELPELGDAGLTPAVRPSRSQPTEFTAEFIGEPLKKDSPAMADDFDIKEMASAIQTVLKREDKG